MASKEITFGSRSSRTCDGCDLCCTVASVSDLGKAAGERCRHLTALSPPGCNCMIYARRPFNCRGFMCLWRASNQAFTDDYFPADCGFCIYLNDPFHWPMAVTVGVDPKRPDSWDRPKYRARFSQLAYDLNAVVVIGEGTNASHAFAPSGRVYAKAEWPEFFIDGGNQVGLRAYDFRPDVRLNQAQIGAVLDGHPEWIEELSQWGP